MDQKMRETKKMVEYFLEKVPRTREDDDFLYLMILEKVSPGVTGRSFFDVFSTPNYCYLPSFKTVCRARRKAQETHPEWRSSTKIATIRRKQKAKYLELAKN